MNPYCEGPTFPKHEHRGSRRVLGRVSMRDSRIQGIKWEFPQFRWYLIWVGVLIIRILLFRVLY